MDFDDVTIQKLQIIHGTLFSIKLNSSKVVMFISSWILHGFLQGCNKAFGFWHCIKLPTPFFPIVKIEAQAEVAISELSVPRVVTRTSCYKV